jgi:hypothetical protein
MNDLQKPKGDPETPGVDSVVGDPETPGEQDTEAYEEAGDPETPGIVRPRVGDPETPGSA